MIYDLALENGTVCDGKELFRANLYVKGGVIALLSGSDLKFQAADSLDCSGLFVLPGFIDPHVHLGLKSGKYVSSDDFDSGSALALSGGVTTLIDFLEPAGSLVDLSRFFALRAREASRSRVDYAFHATLAGSPDFRVGEFVRAVVDLGMPSIKVFTTYSRSGRRTDDGTLLELLYQSRTAGCVVLAHAENDEIILNRSQRARESGCGELPFVRPTVSELAEVVKLVLFSKEANGQLYLVHVSSGDTLETLSRLNTDWKSSAKLETCPQYLLLNDSSLAGETGYLNTYCPPARSERERRLLVAKLVEGILDCIGTDHCPFTEREKLENRKDCTYMPNGVGSLGLAFSTLNTFLEGDLVKIVRLLSRNPALLFGLYPSRASMRPGSIADLVVVERERPVRYKNSPFTRCDYSLFEGMELRGLVKVTVRGGEVAYREGRVLAKASSGRFLRREPIFWSDEFAAE